MKILKRLLVFIIPILIGAFVYFITHFGPIISGFGAKAVCSCVYVGNRTVQSVVDNELNAFPLSLGSFELNESEKSASGSVFGFALAKAIFRKGLGCTLVRELTEEQIRMHVDHVDLKLPVLSDSMYWPIGTRLADTVPLAINLDKIRRVVDSSFKNTHAKIPANTRGVVVVYKGQLIYEKYADGFNENTAQLGWSMTKSVTNMLFGILDKKSEYDIYQPAPVKEWANDTRKNITTDHLMRMSSGLYWEEVYSNVSTATNMLYTSAHMGSFAQMQKAKTTPDSEWYYSSGTTNILSQILREKIGEDDYYHFAQSALFSKLGIRTAIIEPDAGGTHVGSSYMWASARDWARLGQLYLNEGNWFGEQIIAPEWVRYSTTATAGATKGEYGAQWWLNTGELGRETNRLLPGVPTDMYMMDGYEGQRVFVVPSRHLVVVRLGQNKRGGFDHNAFLSTLINSIEK